MFVALFVTVGCLSGLCAGLLLRRSRTDRLPLILGMYYAAAFSLIVAHFVMRMHPLLLIASGGGLIVLLATGTLLLLVGLVIPLRK